MTLFRKQGLADTSKSEERLVTALHLLGDRTRYRIFKLLLHDREMCVSDIAAELEITVSAVSQHFRSFEMVGLVGKQRTGQKICYLLNRDDELVRELVSIIQKGNKIH